MINVTERNSSKSNQPISKTLEMFFIIIQIIFSFDFGFIRYKSRRHKLTVKLITAVLSACLGIVLLIAIAIQNEGLGYIIWYSLDIYLNYVYVIMLLIIPEQNTFYTFLKFLRSVNLKINGDTSTYYLEFKIIAVCIAIAMYKIFISIFYCVFFGGCIKSLLVQIIYLIPLISLEIPSVIHYFVFHAIYLKLVAMRKIMNNDNFKPKQVQFSYKSLHDSLDKIKKAFDPIVSNS